MVLEKSPKPLTVKNMEISFEFFPAKDFVGEKNLWESFERLKKFNSKFISVTFCAGGGERDKTDDLVQKIKNNSLINVADHLTCVDMSIDEINAIATKWLSEGINKIVALWCFVRNEMKSLIERASKILIKKIWDNLDCGLKTRRWPETIASLEMMVQAAKELIFGK